MCPGAQGAPGKLFRKCRIRIHEPLDLSIFYAEPYRREEGQAIVKRLTELLGASKESS